MATFRDANRGLGRIGEPPRPRAPLSLVPAFREPPSPMEAPIPMLRGEQGPWPQNWGDPGPLRPEADPDPSIWAPVVLDQPTYEFEPRPPQASAGYRPDTDFDGWSTRSATVRLASVRGYKHRYEGRPRRDHAEAHVHETGTIVFAVADGVDGARYAELGSVLASAAALDEVISQLDARQHPFDWQSVLQQAGDRLVAEADSISDDPDPARAEELLATTLTVGAAWPSAAGGMVISLALVGDSSAWVLERGRFHPLLMPRTEGPAAGAPDATLPLPRVPAAPVRQEIHLLPGAVLLVGTDGFGIPLGDGEGQVGELFARHLAAPPPPRGLAHLLDFSWETCDDDRTLLALWPLGPERRDAR